MLQVTSNGLYCVPGDFYIDPYRSVPTAVITHGHADHARWGMGHYISTPMTADIMRIRIGKDISVTAHEYHAPFDLNGVRVTLIPAGHILGSAQVVLEHNNQRSIITGDFKTDDDPTVHPFEAMPCDLLVMETTFALPIYHWPSATDVMADIHAFWQQNQVAGEHTVLYAYSLGKAQRLVAGLDSTVGPVAVHRAVDNMNQVYKQYGFLDNLPPVLTKSEVADWDRPGIIIAPPATQGSAWLKTLGRYREAYVSGWMLSRGQTRRRNMRGFVLSDHADWAGLNATVAACAPTQVWTMHGSTHIYAKYLQEQGIAATPLGALALERSEE